MALLSQIAIIVGLIFIGLKHFGSFQMGVGMAAIFLMLPYTAQFGGDSMHLLPGALLIWAIAAYRRPAVAGVLIGIAAGVCYYPLFLLPLWISFYWEAWKNAFSIGGLGGDSAGGFQFGTYLGRLRRFYGAVEIDIRFHSSTTRGARRHLGSELGELVSPSAVGWLHCAVRLVCRLANRERLGMFDQ